MEKFMEKMQICMGLTGLFLIVYLCGRIGFDAYGWTMNSLDRHILANLLAIPMGIAATTITGCLFYCVAEEHRESQCE